VVRVCFTRSLVRHLPIPGEGWTVDGDTVAEVLSAVFADAPTLRGYILNDQGAVRHHVAVFLDGMSIRDRRRLSDAVADGSEIQVLQALSGG
jgi:sulfur carrier protein ThiS